MPKPVYSSRRFQIYVSDRPAKKYVAVLANGKRVHFGQRGYDQYKDKLGHYSKHDHLDLGRRKSYYARHGNANLYSAKWFSHKFLW